MVALVGRVQADVWQGPELEAQGQGAGGELSLRRYCRRLARGVSLAG